MDLQGKLEDGFENFQSLDSFRKASPLHLGSDSELWEDKMWFSA